MNRIICVEGVSGAGKSTLCQFLSLRLHQLKVPHRWHAEFDQDNPVRLPEDRADTILETTRCWEALLRDQEGTALAAGDGSPTPGMTPTSGGDTAFSAGVAASPLASGNSLTRLFDGRLLLLNVEFSLKCGKTLAQVRQEMEPLIQLANSCKGFTLIYLDTRSAERLFGNTVRVRKAQDWYLQTLEHSVTHLDLPENGVERVHAYHQMVNGIMNSIYDSLDCKKIRFDVADLDWQATHAGILDFLGLSGSGQGSQSETGPSPDVLTGLGGAAGSTLANSLVPGPAGSAVTSSAGSAAAGLAEFAGEYRDFGQDRYEIVYRDGVLHVDHHPYLCYQPVEQVWTLIPFEKDRFAPRGQPLTLRFLRDGSGKIHSLKEEGHLREESVLGRIKAPFFRVPASGGQQ